MRKYLVAYHWYTRGLNETGEGFGNTFADIDGPLTRTAVETAERVIGEEMDSSRRISARAFPTSIVIINLIELES